MSKITKMELTKFLRQMLTTNEKWAIGALMRIYDNQTNTEQMNENTHCINGIGFTVGDAKLLTRFAEFYKNRGFLSKKQMVWVFNKIGKYASQLMKQEYFSIEKLEICYRKVNFAG